jgi:hypothetical protein
MIGAILGPILNIIGPVLTRLIPDKDLAAKMTQEVTVAIIAQQGQLNAAAGEIIKAEAQSEHWLTSAWRPITMLSFVAIIVNNYILAPYAMLFFDVNVALETPPDLWDLIKIGLGGYVMGRSAEKAIATWKAGGS